MSVNCLIQESGPGDKSVIVTLTQIQIRFNVESCNMSGNLPSLRKQSQKKEPFCGEHIHLWWFRIWINNAWSSSYKFILNAPQKFQELDVHHLNSQDSLQPKGKERKQRNLSLKEYMHSAFKGWSTEPNFCNNKTKVTVQFRYSSRDVWM